MAGKVISMQEFVGQGQQIIKRRIAHLKPSRIVLHDKEMKEAGLVPNTPFKCVFKKGSRTLIILPTDAPTGHTVSYDRRTAEVTPVIDLRNRATQELFTGAEYIQIVIYKAEDGSRFGRIEISAYVSEAGTGEVVEEEPASAAEAEARVECGRVTDITQLLRVKHLATVCLSGQELEQAVGGSHSAPIRSFVDQVAAFQPVLEFHKPLVREYLEYVRMAMKAVSIFPGMGALDLAASLAGLEVIFALDWNEDAVETYRANIGHHIIREDFRQFDKTRIPKASIMIGGPPCVGFSNENRTNGGVENPNNDLVRHFIEAAAQNDKCLVVVCENAPGLLTLGDGKYLRMFQEYLPNFTITSGVINALDYGGAMDRSRTVVIASRIGAIPVPVPTTPPSQYRTLRWALEGVHDGLPQQREIPEWGPGTTKRFTKIPEGGNWRSLPDAERETFHPGTHSNKFRRLSMDEACISLVSGWKTPVAHPRLNRGLSVREHARVMGLPDRFSLRGSRTAKQLQLANAVCVHPWYHVFMAVRQAIEQHAIREVAGFRY